MTRVQSWESFTGQHPQMFKECLPPESRAVFEKVVNKGMGGKLMARAETQARAFAREAHDYGYLRGLIEGKQDPDVEKLKESNEDSSLLSSKEDSSTQSESPVPKLPTTPLTPQNKEKVKCLDKMEYREDTV